MAIQDKEHILGTGYKYWYHHQPKLLKIVVLPFLAAISVVIIEYNDLEGWWLFVPALLLLLTLYNQYLDTILNEFLDKDLLTAQNKMKAWRDSSEDYVYLNNILNELVENKSDMFLRSSKTAIDEDVEAAIVEIRELGSLKNSLDRIFAVLYKIFERHADIQNNQKFRVSYLVPDSDGNHLVAKSWFNIDKVPPRSVLEPNGTYFSKGDSTTAGYLWANNGKEDILIDNIDEFLNEKKDINIFHYTHPDQANYLKSIYCYKVMNNHECIGIICVDSNVPDTFRKRKQFYKNALESFSKRIIFETRCAYMKKSLSREED